MIASDYQGRQKSKDLVNSLVWSWEIAWRPTLYIWSDLQTLTLWTKECWEGPKYFSIIRQITVPRLTGPNTFQFFRRWVSSKHHAGSLAPPIWCLSWLNYHPSMGRDRHGDIRKIFTLWERGGVFCCLQDAGGGGGGGGGWEDGTAHRLFIDLYSTRSSARTGWVLATGRVLAIKLN